MDNFVFDRWLTQKDAISYVTNKEKSCKAYMQYMAIRLQQMFSYENLPDEIPKFMLERYLLFNGSALFTKYNDKYYVFVGNAGGEPNEYYLPTKYVVANPALKLNKTYTIGEDCVLMRNDSSWLGLYPLMARYASLLAENVVTMRVADIMLRITALLSAPDDKSKLSAEAYLAKLEKGELGVIGDNAFLDGVKLQSPPSNNGSYLTQFIELHQYYKGSFYNEIGLNANFNMKREAIGDGETSMNEDSLLPLCDEMLKCRQEDINKINEMFGLGIKVDFSSAWKSNHERVQLELEQLEQGGEDNEDDLSSENESDNNNEGTDDSIEQQDDSSECDDIDTQSEGASESDEDGTESDDRGNNEQSDRPEDDSGVDEDKDDDNE